LIGQAVGIVMYRYVVGEQAAFAYLTRISQNSNVKLHDVASRIVATPLQAPTGTQPTGADSVDRDFLTPTSAPAPTDAANSPQFGR
jgi:hypothetical protein